MKPTQELITVTGIIEDKIERIGKTTGKPYYVIKVDGQDYSTFEKEIFDLSKGTQIEFRYSKNGNYRNMAKGEWEPLNKVPEESVGMGTTSNNPKLPTASPTEKTNQFYKDSEWYARQDQEKKDFENQKQHLIVRQSSVSSSILLFNSWYEKYSGLEAPGIEDVTKEMLKIAKEIEDFVWAGFEKPKEN